MTEPRKVTKDFVSANILKVMVEHNGLQGGDTGHGGYVEITFENEACTDMSIRTPNTEIVQRDREQIEDGQQFSIRVQGDTERETLTQALLFIAEELSSNVYWNTETDKTINV